MYGAIIGGTGFDRQLGVELSQEVVETPYGAASLYRGQGALEGLIFLPRHGPEHRIPPHRINYRANLKALAQLGVERVLATFAVGSLHPGIPPGALVALDQFIDFTQGRAGTFFDGGASGLVHTEMTHPYCPALRAQLLALAPEYDLDLVSQGTYVCTDGPRFETAAEVRMYAQLGGDVVGMTGMPEASLARELGLHYAAVALSINWGAGLEEKLEIVRGLEATERALLALFNAVLQQSSLPVKCNCETAAHVIHPPAT